MSDYTSIIQAHDAATAAAAPPAANDDPFAGGGTGTSTGGVNSSISDGLQPGTAPQPAAPDNPYASVVSDIDSARTLAGSQALYGAKDNDPDKAAEANGIQQQIGGSANVIEQNLPVYRQQVQAQRNQQILGANPALADWLSQNPLNPKVAQDDLHNLTAVSSWGAQWRQGWSDGIGGNALNRLYFEGQGSDPAKVASLEASLQSSTNSPAGSGLIHFLASNAAALADGFRAAAPLAGAGAITGGGIGALAAGVPTAGFAAPVGATAGAAAGASAGFESGMWLDGYRTNAGGLLHDLDGVHDAAGNPIDPTVKLVAAHIAGFVGGTLNLIGLGAGGRIVGEGLSSLLSQGLSQAIGRPGVGAALARAAVNIGKGGFTGAALGGLMETSNVLAEQGARMASGDDFSTILNDPEQRQDAIARIADSAETMALQLGAIHGVGALPPVIGEALRARRAGEDLEALNGLSQTAQASALRQRDPSTFESWVASQTTDGRAENLFVPGDAVAELYQRKGITPGPDDGLLGAFTPDIAEQMEQARANGGDVVLPTAGFVTHMAGTEEGAALQPHVRIGEDGMSATDLDAYMAAHADALQARGDELQQLHDRQRAETTGAQAVHDDARGQLQAAGYAPDTAEQYATLIASRYAARAARLGDDPLELYRSENLSIEGPEKPQALQGSVPDSLDLLINAARSDRPEDTMGSLFGPSLLQFLSRRGGIEDPGGDLKAMGAGDWHKGQPGVRRLLRPSRAEDGPGLPGMAARGETPHSPDTVALAAHEAGYFPGEERPDIQALHDAIGRELGGEPVYSQHYSDGPREARAAEYLSAVRDLRDTLDRKGIDRKTATNAEIRAALEADGQTFNQSAWHGSPHLFDRFSTQHIGTGEGAQAFGHGLYFAGNRQIAEYYRRVLSERDTRGDVEAKGLLARIPGTVEQKRAELISRRDRALKNNPSDADSRAFQSKIAAALEMLDRGDGGNGRLYKVEIPEDHEFLSWDRKLSEQSPQVREALQGLDPEHLVDAEADPTGAELYRALSQRLAIREEAPADAKAPAGWGYVEPEVRSDPAAASEALHDAGIPGIRYRDAGSRGTEAGSHNYVVFNDRHVEVRSYEQRKPVATIAGDEIAPKDAALPDLRAAARDYYADHLRGTSVRSEALGRDVEFRSGRKAFANSANPDKLRLFAALRDVIQHGDLVDSSPPRDPAAEKSTKAYHFIAAPVELDGRTVRVGVTVREDTSGQLYYNHTPIDETGAPADRPAGTRLEGGPGTDGEERSGGATRDTARKAGPRDTAGGDTTFEQRMGAEPDDVNMDVRDFNAGDTANPDTLRGSISLSPYGATIRLFAKRDLSTFLHEAGHLWGDELLRDADTEGAPQQVKDDAATLRQWVGAEPGAALTVEQHEQLARGFEAYLMEGRAPSAALRSAFRSFRAWLVGIYRAISGLRVELSPEIRGVMDRLVASDEEIDRALDQQALDGLFKTAGDAGMTDREFATYREAVERARSRAVDSLTTKVMGDVRRERQAWWKHQEEPIREDVQSEVDGRPEMRALDLLRTGRLTGAEGEPGARIKLDRQELIDIYGSPAVLDLLPRRVPPIYGDNGMPADVVANMVGARSGDDLVKALLAHEDLRRQLRARGDKRSVRAYTIDTAVHDQMVDRHGEVLTDGTLEGEALDRIHDQRQMEVLATELRALGRRAGADPTPLGVVKAWADRSIGGKQIAAGTRPGFYLRAEAKAGRATEAALLAGDHKEAFRQKQAQMFSHALYLSAKLAKEDVDKGMALMQRLGARTELKSIQTDFADRVHEMIRRFGMRVARNDDELDRGLAGASLQSWATERLAEGHEFFVAPDMYDQTYAKPVDELTVNQFRDLSDTVRSLAHAGRELEQVTVEGEKIERAVVVGQMTAAMDGLHQRDGRDFANQGGATGARGVGERMVQGAQAFHAMLLKPETILDTLDGRDPNGIFNRAVWRPIKAAQGVENDLLKEVTGQLTDLHQSLGKGYGKDFDKQIPAQPGIVDPRTGEPMALKRRGVIGIALNVGNESNLQRLLDGYNWTPEAVQALLDRHMTEADWRFVQGAWDTFENLFPRIEAMQRRMTGVGLEKVTSREVATPHGTFRGGYYPVIYDPNLSTLGDRIKATGDARFEADYQRATTSKGHTISRVQNVREPLSLDPDQMAWKLRQAVHDLAYREAIVNADKLLKNRDVIAGMDRTVGRDQRRQLDRWLQGVANDQNIDTRGLAAMDSFLHRLRTNAMVVGIGFRASTMLKHGSTALSNSIGELGPKWMLQGTREFFGSPDKMRRQYEFITGASAEMRHRMNEIDRDVRDALRDTMGKPGIVPALARFSHYGVAMLDMGSALPTWLGAYRRALAAGEEESDAVAIADKTVRNAHGANGAPDLAAIQRGSEAQKLMTMFYGFFNHVYNRQAVGVQSAVSGVRNLRAGQFGAARGDFAHALATFFFYLAMPALIEATVAEGLPTDQDGEGWLAWAGKAIAGAVPAGIPVLRDVASAAMHGRSYATSPTGQAFDTFIALGKDAASATGLRQAPASDRWLQHAVTAPGYVFGLPTGQAAGTAQFLADVAGGQEDPQSVQDWLRGITFGPAPKKAAQ